MFGLKYYVFVFWLLIEYYVGFLLYLWFFKRWIVIGGVLVYERNVKYENELGFGDEEDNVFVIGEVEIFEVLLNEVVVIFMFKKKLEFIVM